MNRHLRGGLLERAREPLRAIGLGRCANEESRVDDPARPAGADADETADDDEHLEDLPDGAGCTEIWEYLSEREEHD